MKSILSILCVPRVAVCVLAAAIAAMSTSVSSAEEGGQARFFLLDPVRMEHARALYEAGDPGTVADMNLIIRSAEQKLRVGPFTVMNTPEVAPSGDPHDLVSYGPYSWPNPNTPDGLPWIGRDGHNNPDSVLDWGEFYGLGRAAEPLMLAYYFTGDEKYAEKTASLMRTWFLDPATRMNPRDEYSGIVPGRNVGRFEPPGYANMFGRRQFMDALGMLEASPHWTAEDRAGMEQWFRDFIAWGAESPKSYVQFIEPSNHGTSFDLLFGMMGAYIEDPEFARANFQHFVNNRFPGQIAEDGSNPLEMKRANNLLYHRRNLNLALAIGEVGKKVGVDLFDHVTDEGLSHRMQVDYLIPYWLGEKEWDQWPGDPFVTEPDVYYETLRRAAAYFGDPRYLDTAAELGKIRANYRYANLIYPVTAVYEQVWAGDANVDGYFDENDLVMVFTQGLYEDDIVGNAGWENGDWNQDGDFTTSDLVAAFEEGGYRAGMHPLRSPAAAAVPEPVAWLGFALSSMLVFAVHRRRRNDTSGVPS